jgi:hypothetical protein
LEGLLSRVIKTETAAKDRTRLTRSVVLALRELMRQTQPDDHSRDLAAYISLALLEIHKTIDASVIAWEKRGYWVKADRFRMDWEWTQISGEKISQAVFADDWATIAITAAKVAQKLMGVDVPVRHRLGTPWVGAWKILKEASGRDGKSAWIE